MTVVADAGPLIALAKIGGLRTLLDLYPQIITPAAVYEETVREGRRARAPDAALLQAKYDAGGLRVEALQGPVPASTRRLGRGERESIQLALQQRADWLLVDDLEARQSAVSRFASSGASTRVKGTLGVITSAYLEGVASLESAVRLLNAIRARGDIWISVELCQQVENVLLRAAGETR